MKKIKWRALVACLDHLVDFRMTVFDVDSMVARQLYQLIITRLDGDKLFDETYRSVIRELVEKGIGGFILFGGEKEKVKPFLQMLQSQSELPLFIASDIERGVGQQVRGYTLFACQMAMAAMAGSDPAHMELLRDSIRAVAEEAIDLGINMPLTPVLDVNTECDNPIICTRAFSDNPEEVARLGIEYIGIFQRSGLIACPKHFPGHGATVTDSHLLLPVIERSYAELAAIDIVPFTRAIEMGARAVMIGHVSVPALDKEPASLSRKIITGMLREEFGFQGLVLTDALNMSAVSNIPHLAARCLRAGVDILLHPADPDTMVEDMVSSMKSDFLSSQLVDAAVQRIRKAKAGISYTPIEVNYPGHESLSLAVQEKSVSILKDERRSLPLKKDDRVVLILAGDADSVSLSPLKNLFSRWEELDKVGKWDEFTETAVVAVFTGVSAWKGTSGISGECREGILRVMRRAARTVIVSFGSPYVLRHFPDADVLLAAYEATEKAQHAAYKCLYGKMPCSGSIPVKIE